MPVPIRPATLDDVPALHALIERAYRGPPARGGWTHEADLIEGPRTDAASLTAIIADPASTILVAIATGAIVACLQVTDRGQRAYLGQLAVAPERQAGGLGRAMLSAGEHLARDRGAADIEMTVIDRRAELIAYYARRGYAATGEIRPFPFAQPIAGPPLELVVLAKPLR